MCVLKILTLLILMVANLIAVFFSLFNGLKLHNHYHNRFVLSLSDLNLASIFSYSLTCIKFTLCGT